MKKVRMPAVLLIFFMLLLLPACGNVDKSEGIKYKDGTYTAEGDKWDNGFEASVVNIKNGKISSVELKRLTTDGKEVNYDDWTGAQGPDGKVRPNLRKFRTDMAKQMVQMQTYDIDTVSTATQSSVGWKQSTQRALEKAK